MRSPSRSASSAGFFSKSEIIRGFRHLNASLDWRRDEEGFIERSRSEQDQRKRLLALTDKGKALENELVDKQRRRIAQAYRNAGADAVEGFRRVLLNIMDDSGRKRFDGDRASG